MKRFAVLFLCSCAYEGVSKTITTADIGNAEATRVTTYLNAPMRAGNPSETISGSIARTAIADDATLVQARSDEVCFTLTTRNTAELDVPFEGMNVTFDGVAVKMRDEKVTVRDYPESGGAAQTLVEDLERADWGRLPKEKPASGSVRVFERAGTGCAKMAGLPSELTLELRIPKEDGKGDYGEKFVWKLK